MEIASIHGVLTDPLVWELMLNALELELRFMKKLIQGQQGVPGHCVKKDCITRVTKSSVKSPKSYSLVSSSFSRLAGASAVSPTTGKADATSRATGDHFLVSGLLSQEIRWLAIGQSRY
jgi:hypothetical protein